MVDLGAVSRKWGFAFDRMSGSGNNSVIRYPNKSYVEDGRNKARLKEQIVISFRTGYSWSFLWFSLL